MLELLDSVSIRDLEKMVDFLSYFLGINCLLPEIPSRFLLTTSITKALIHLEINNVALFTHQSIKFITWFHNRGIRRFGAIFNIIYANYKYKITPNVFFVYSSDLSSSIHIHKKFIKFDIFFMKVSTVFPDTTNTTVEYPSLKMVLRYESCLEYLLPINIKNTLKCDSILLKLQQLHKKEISFIPKEDLRKPIPTDLIQKEYFSSICKICMNSRITHIIGCGHGFCEKCLAHFDKCAICRNPFSKENVIKIFI